MRLRDYSLVTDKSYASEDLCLFSGRVPRPSVKIFPYKWKMSDLPEPAKDAPTVFSCFCGAGGSSLGYKLAGYRSLGGCDLDKRQSAPYRDNLKPKFFYDGFVKDLVANTPKGMPRLDVLDGSPPCSVFSTAGVREGGWGVEKHFREGQAAQVLDRLFWDFLDVAAAWKPKVIIGENVLGMTKGKAIPYLGAIQQDYLKAGYTGKWYVVDASKFGLPQRRVRVFFVAVRSDLERKLIKGSPYYAAHKRLALKHPNARPVPFSKIRDPRPSEDLFINPDTVLAQHAKKMRELGLYGSLEQVHENGSLFNNKRVDTARVLNTVPAAFSVLLVDERTGHRTLSERELYLASSWPMDYVFPSRNAAGYGVGMSVPPAMCASVASAVKDQWLVHL